MDEKALIKKGAFASTTKFGAEERVVVESGGVSEYRTGYNKLETLTLRYGHVSQLLILGCPVEKFRVQQAPVREGCPEGWM
jgi:glutathione peroxidase-family protein